jgi:tetratricopeptide (TPR) repeat protein
MTGSDRLGELLQRWRDECRRGRDLTPSELCPDDPALAERLGREIARLRQGETEPAAADGSPPGFPGGRYRPLRFHAAGGLGEVFTARDEELGREVALKRMKDRVAGREDARARFLREAEITGRLEHPGIVPVYGLVRAGDGPPCYAMRFVRGESLKDAVERFHREHPTARAFAGVAFRQLVQRFVAVCQAVAYAHSRGVVHRDLKPANVMLGPYGETLVIDWGLAKTVGREGPHDDPAEETLLPTVSGEGSDTRTGSAVGTPGFMAPEQAAGRWAEVGPAADVFGLGATLYALLTGHAPYQGGRAVFDAQSGFFEPPRQVRPDAPAALAAVCLKAMARGPEDRYPTALELAKDLELWLADEPVGAYAEPWPARLARWARRHQVMVAAAGVLLVTLAASLAVGAGLVAREQRQTEAALKVARDERAEADRQREVAVAERQKASDLLGRVRQIARSNWVARMMDRDPWAAKVDVPTALQMIAFVATSCEVMAEVSESDPAMRDEQAPTQVALASVYLTLDQKDRSDAAFRQGLAAYEAAERAGGDPGELRRKRAFTHVNRARALKENHGRPAGAAAELQAAAGLFRGLDRPEAREWLARCLGELGADLQELGRRDEALAAFREAADLWRELTAQLPGPAGRGPTPERTEQLARAHQALARFYRDAQPPRPAEALAAFRQAVTTWQSLSDRRPDDAASRNELAVTQNELGLFHEALGDWGAAGAAFAEARANGEALVRAEPFVPLYRTNLGLYHRNAGRAARLGPKDLARAEASYRQARALFERLCGEHPGDVPARSNLADVLFETLELAAPQHPARAAEVSRDLAAVFEGLCRLQPKNAEFATKLGRCYGELAIWTARTDRARLDEALGYDRKAIAALEPVVARDPGNAAARRELAGAYDHSGCLHSFLGRHAEALADHDRAIGREPEGAERTPSRLLRLAALAHSGRHAEAVRGAAALAGDRPDDPAVCVLLAGVYACAAGAAAADPHLPAAERTALADRHAARAVGLIREALRRGFDDPAIVRTSPRFDPIRSRADFRRLLDELKPGGG